MKVYTESEIRQWCKAQVDCFGLREFCKRECVNHSTISRFVRGKPIDALTMSKLGWEQVYVLGANRQIRRSKL